MRVNGSPKSHRTFVVLSVLTASVLLGGCVSLTPYEDVVASLPESQFVMIDGQRIHVERRGSGPTLLMLHGFAASTYSFRKIIPALAENHRVVAVDLNGFGFTERPADLEQYQAAAQVKTIRRLLDQLGIDRCDVVAHSYGGALAILLADKEPARVRRIVLISPYTEFGETPAILKTAAGRKIAYQGTRLLLGSRAIARAGVRRAFYQDNLVTREVAEEYRRRILIEGFPDAFDGYSLAMEESGPIQLPLAAIDQPALIIAGRHDKLVSVGSCERAAARIQRSQLRILEKSGHSAAEEQPAEVVQLIEEFL